MLVKWMYKKGAMIPLHFHPHEQITWITEGIAVDRPEELASAFKKALSLNKPVLLDIRTGNYPTPVKISPF
jgi:hypothetical protein